MQISNDVESALVNGSASADTIENTGHYATVRAGAGNDYILNDDGDSALIAGDEGNDTIEGIDNDYVTVEGGNGNDVVQGVFYSSEINGGAGNDAVEVELADDSTINGGDGADSISGVYIASSINGGTGNDYIEIQSSDEGESENNTIVGGKGNDTIYNAVAENYEDEEEIPGNVYQYAQGDGNDYFVGINSNDTLQITGGSISNTEFDEEGNVILTIGVNKITLESAQEKTIWLQLGDNEAVEFPLQTDTVVTDTITGTSKADNIVNERDEVTIDALAGNDTVENSGSFVSISAGASNDKIYNSGNDVTVSGGKGNDTVVNEGSNFVYEFTGGKDVIEGYSEGDEIILGGKKFTASIVNEDWILSLSNNGGSITIKGASEFPIIVDGATIEPVTPPPKGWKISSSVATAISTSAENFDLSETYAVGIKRVDASKVTGGILISGNTEEISTSIKTGKGNDTLDSGYGGNDTLTGGAGADVFIYQGGNDIITDYGTGNDTIQIVLDDMENISTETSGTSVLVKTNEGTITLQQATGKTLNLIDINGDNITIKTVESLVGTAKAETLENSDDEIYIDALAGNDRIENSGDNVTIIGGKGNDTIYNSGDGNTYKYSKGDGNDVIVGFGENDTLTIEGGTYTYDVKGSDFVVKVGNNTITLKDAASQTIFLNNETIPPQIVPPEGWTYSNTQKTIVKATTKTGVEILDLREEYGEGVSSVDASAVTVATGVEIIGNDDGNSIKASKGADIVTGGTGDDTISLGGGADTYVYNGGDDIIQDYKAGDDVIQVNGTEITNVSVKGNDLIFLFTDYEGSLTVKNGNKATQVLVVNENGEQIYPETVPAQGWKFDTSKHLMEATIKTAETFIDLLNEDYGEGVTTVDSSKKIIDDVVIVGNNLGNSIKTGKGNDIIYGGTDNDTISLGAGQDTYVYQGGDDIIQDYAANTDVIQINIDGITADNADTVISSVASGSNVVFDIGDAGKLTINKGNGKKITLVDSNDEEITLDSITPLPDGWTIDSGKKQITAKSTSPENLDLTESYGDGVTTVDASKAKNGVEVIGNDDNNSIKGSKQDDTITGGTGNDTISLGAGADVYVYTGGDDYIWDYTTADSIQMSIDGDNMENISIDTIGANVIISADNSQGNITVKGASGKVVTLLDKNGEVIYPVDQLPDGWQYDSNHSQIHALVDYPDELDLTEKYGNGVKVVDASNAKSGVTIKGGNTQNLSIQGSESSDVIITGKKNDTISMGKGADTLIYGGGDDVIQDYATIDVIQVDTDNFTFNGAATVGTNVVYYIDSSKITVLKGSGKDIDLVDQNGERIIPPDDTLPPGWKYDTAKTMISATLSSPEDLDLTQKYGENVIKVDASKALNVSIVGNEKNNSIKGGKGNDIIVGGSGNDTVSLGSGEDTYVFTGGDDIIQDYAANADAIQIKVDGITASNANKSVSSIASGSNLVLKIGSAGNLTVTGGKGKDIALYDKNGDEITLDGGDITVPDGWTIDSAKKQLTATVKSGADDVDLTEDDLETVEKVNGSKLTEGVLMKGNTRANSIKGGSGADTIYGGKGNDTVSLGGGSDLYIYTEGDDVIQDYRAGQDEIQFEAKLQSASLKSANVVITTEEGTVTLLNAKGKVVSVYDSDGAYYEFTDVADFSGGGDDELEDLPAGASLNSSKNTVTLSTKFVGDTFDLSKYKDTSKVRKINASALTTGVEIIGNDLGNTINGGKGDDTLTGGEGNDSLKGGNGNDLFIYTGGNDIIDDYKAGQDSIQINTTNIEVNGIATVGSNVVIDTELGNITIKGGKGKDITLINEEGEDILFDDSGNYVNANAADIDSISEISDINYSTGKIELGSEADILSAENSYTATYGKDENK